MPRLIHIVLITCFMTLLLSTSNGAIIVRTNYGTDAVIPAVQILYRDNPTMPIESPITLDFSTNLNDTFNKTVILPIARTMDDVAVMAQDNGAVALIGLYTQGPFVPGMSKFRIYSKETTLAVRIPVFSVAGSEKQQLADLLQQNEVMSVEIIPEDLAINPWDTVFLSNGVLAGNVIIVLLYGANICLAVWKIVIFSKHYRAKLSVAVVVLTCELIANLLRVLSGIDPFGQNYIYYNERVGQAFGTCSYPFAVSAFLLLSLYWHQMVTAGSLKVASFLTKMKIPFFVISSVLIGMTVLGNILYATTFMDVNFVLGLIYTVILAACVVFYAIAGGMVFRRLSQARKRGKIVRLHRVTFQIIISGACYVTFMLMVMLGSCGLFPTPLAFTIVFGATSVALGVASLLNILSFETDKLLKGAQTSNNSAAYSVKSRANTMTGGDAPNGAPATNPPDLRDSCASLLGRIMEPSAGSKIKDSRKSRTNSGTYSASGTDAPYDTHTEATNSQVV